MATTKNKPQLPNWIKTAVEKQVELELDEIIKDAKAKLEQKRAEILARAMIKITDRVSYQTLGEEIIITVKKEV